jgi:hypothetical protein
MLADEYATIAEGLRLGGDVCVHFRREPFGGSGGSDSSEEDDEDGGGASLERRQREMAAAAAVAALQPVAVDDTHAGAVVYLTPLTLAGRSQLALGSLLSTAWVRVALEYCTVALTSCNCNLECNCGCLSVWS